VTDKSILLPLDTRMLNGFLDPVILVDQEQTIVGYNKASADLFRAELSDLKLKEVIPKSQIEDVVANTLDGNPGSNGEVFLPYPVARQFEFNVWRLPDLKSPAPAWAMVVLRDITAAAKAAEMRADFVANVSHELRSPLSALLGFIETLRGPARDDVEATNRFLAIMETEAQRMARLINDLLALSKLETEEHIQPEGIIDLKPVLGQVKDILSFPAEKRGMRIFFDVRVDTAYVQGDADELTQVFQNLLSNAISYGYKNTTVRIVLKRGVKILSSKQTSTSVAIVNQGDSISDEEIPRLTERFYRVDKGRSRSEGGTGLGLAIVKHLISRHRGHLNIKSENGESTFTVLFPEVPKHKI